MANASDDNERIAADVAAIRSLVERVATFEELETEN